MLYGFYQSSYFFMWLNFDGQNQESLNRDLDFRKTILHESIHFVQDFSLYGLSHIDSKNQILRSILIRCQRQKRITIPIIPSEYMCEIDYINKNIINMTHNNPNNPSKIYKNKLNYFEIRTSNYTEYNEYAKDEEKKKMNYGNIDYVTIINHVTKKQMYLCALDIIESMASLIEQGVYSKAPNNRLYYNLPYDSAELIVDLVYPEFGTKKANIVGLCEYALCTFNPGYEFYQALTIMKKSKFIPETPNEIFSYFKYGNFEGETREEYYKKYVDRFLNDVKELYSPFLINTLTKYMQNINAIREKSNCKWAEGLLLEAKERESYYIDILNDIRSPLIILRNNCMGDIELMDVDKEHPYYLYGLFATESILMYGEIIHKDIEEKECLLKKCGCPAAKTACDKYPWHNDKNKCVIANIWALRGLPLIVDRKIPIY